MKYKWFAILGMIGVLTLPIAYAEQGQQQKGIQAAGNSTLAGLSDGQKCDLDLQKYNEAQTTGVKVVTEERKKECEILKSLGDNSLEKVNAKETTIQSRDKRIQCIKKEQYTVDYAPCERAVSYYDAVATAEAAMNVQQQIQTDVKNKNIQNEANKKIAAGDTQTSMFDAAIESNQHQKRMQQEKMVAYGAAVTALVAAYRTIPDIDDVKKDKCKSNDISCQNIITNNRASIVANQGARSTLQMAIATFTAKALAAGIAMGQYNNAANQVANAKQTVTDNTQDLMMERCTFNPTDPACAKTPTTGTPTGSIGSGTFGLDGTIGNNSFNLTPDSDSTLNPDADPIKDDGKPVAGVNNPFVDDAKAAHDILNPAAAAQARPGGPAQGGGGGAGGGMGGGSASVGSDLSGVDKDANKEASIKAKEISGNYAAGGGGGYKGVSGGKDDANPFSNLFDAKSDGGIEEDRSIASDDPNSASSGLFQKISKRYSQVQADKRIEANNLE